MSLYRLGVDVGGTNTDAAIVDITVLDNPGTAVIATEKVPTTPDITSGIQMALKAVLDTSAIRNDRILSVNIGTTHFINALVEADARRLDRVAVVRLCGKSTRQLHPFSGFPVGLGTVLDGGSHYLDGGLEVNGGEIAPLNVEQIRATAHKIASSGIQAVALVGVYSPLDYQGLHEERCKSIMLEVASSLSIVCSHDIGPTGFLERENATILNAAILRTGQRVKRSFQRAMAHLQLRCPLYLSQNDGTLMDAELAAEYPIKTFASGPTNSVTGAAFLSGLDEALGSISGDKTNADHRQILVVDIGGTTTDVCALLPSGFPRPAPGFVEFGGIRTAFSMPEVESIGIGGGSKVFVQGNGEVCETVSVGPGSVGHLIQEQAKVFGGSTLTATDVTVATGKFQLGDISLLQDIPRDILNAARRQIKKKLEAVIEKMKVCSAPVTVLLVGGGALLVTDDLAGVESFIRPPHQGAANAVGAAIGKVSGEIDLVEILERRTESEVVEYARSRAIELAIDKGAAPESVKIAEINKMPLQYMSQTTIRVQVKAVGRLAIPHNGSPLLSSSLSLDLTEDEPESPKVPIPNALKSTTKPTLGVDIAGYTPHVVKGVWYISEIDLEFIATGCGVLGTGGGGPTHYEFLKCLQSMRAPNNGKMRVISAKSLQDDAKVCMGMWYGSPNVINERTSGGNEIISAIDEIRKETGISSFQALMVEEIGGANGMCAFPLSVHYDVPVVDGDGMGRAFPTLYHVILSVYGHPLAPCAITDAAGNVALIKKIDRPTRLEKMMRSTAVELGLTCAAATNPLPGAVIKNSSLHNTISQAWYLGRAAQMARQHKANYIDAMSAVSPIKLLFTGKIVDVHRYIGGGYTMGSVILAPIENDEREDSTTQSCQYTATNKHMVIPFQNEYLYAAFSDEAGSKHSQEVVCTVPHLISILGQDGEALGSQDLRYGLRVNVISLPAHPLWLTETALEIGGPAGFGLDMPVVGGWDEGYTELKSVIEEFDQK